MSSSSTKATVVSLVGCFLAGATSAYVVTTLIQNRRKENKEEGTLRQRRKQQTKIKYRLSNSKPFTRRTIITSYIVFW